MWGHFTNIKGIHIHTLRYLAVTVPKKSSSYIFFVSAPKLSRHAVALYYQKHFTHLVKSSFLPSCVSKVARASWGLYGELIFFAGIQPNFSKAETSFWHFCLNKNKYQFPKWATLILLSLGEFAVVNAPPKWWPRQSFLYSTQCLKNPSRILILLTIRTFEKKTLLILPLFSKILPNSFWFFSYCKKPEFVRIKKN